MNSDATKMPGWLRARSLRRLDRSPEKVADRLLRIFGITRPPIDVEAIARGLDVHVHYVRKHGWSGAVKSDGDTAHIWINAAEHPTRQRFTLAHELGHLLLHPTGQMEFRDFNFRGPKETEANKFAAALLMPLDMLEPLAVLPWHDRDTLAPVFQVSPRAMQIQLIDLFGGDVEW